MSAWWLANFLCRKLNSGRNNFDLRKTFAHTTLGSLSIGHLIRSIRGAHGIVIWDSPIRSGTLHMDRQYSVPFLDRKLETEILSCKDSVQRCYAMFINDVFLPHRKSRYLFYHSRCSIKACSHGAMCDCVLSLHGMYCVDANHTVHMAQLWCIFVCDVLLHIWMGCIPILFDSNCDPKKCNRISCSVNEPLWLSGSLTVLVFERSSYVVSILDLTRW